MQEGIIKVLKDGYGFIKTETGDVFFHANNLVDGVEYDSLEEGMTLSFEVGEGRNGKEQAINVQLVETEVGEGRNGKEQAINDQLVETEVAA